MENDELLKDNETYEEIDFPVKSNSRAKRRKATWRTIARKRELGKYSFQEICPVSLKVKDTGYRFYFKGDKIYGRKKRRAVKKSCNDFLRYEAYDKEAVKNFKSEEKDSALKKNADQETQKQDPDPKFHENKMRNKEMCFSAIREMSFPTILALVLDDNQHYELDQKLYSLGLIKSENEARKAINNFFGLDEINRNFDKRMSSISLKSLPVKGISHVKTVWYFE